MPRRFHMPALDKLAVGLSGLCLIHCVLSVVLVSIFASAGTLLTSPSVHHVGLIGAVLLGALALGQGYAAHGARRPALIGLVGLALMKRALDVPHGSMEVLLTVVGVSILAFAHVLNSRHSARHRIAPAQIECATLYAGARRA